MKTFLGAATISFRHHYQPDQTDDGRGEGIHKVKAKMVPNSRDGPCSLFLLLAAWLSLLPSILWYENVIKMKPQFSLLVSLYKALLFM